jgi:hypothetical protein
MTKAAENPKSAESAKKYTKKDIKDYISDIEKKIVNSDGAYLHSIVALNEILRVPEIQDLLDDELKGHMRDLWVKLKSSGVQLTDPPILFGLPEDFGKEQEMLVESEDVPEIEDDHEEPPKKSKKTPPAEQQKEQKDQNVPDKDQLI